MTTNETPKPPSSEWEKQLFYCPAHGFRVTGIDCDAYFKKQDDDCPHPCDLRERHLNICASPAKKTETADTPAPEIKELKQCARCKNEKRLDDFSSNKSMKDGKDPLCRECKKQRNKEYRDRRQKKQMAKDPAPEDIPESQIHAPALKQKTTPAAIPGQPEHTALHLDLTEYPDILTALEQTAKKEFRTVHGQILFTLNQVAGGKYAAQT